MRLCPNDNTELEADGYCSHCEVTFTFTENMIDE